MKKAVLSLDVEDWYHLDYFDRRECDTNISLLDGLDRYVELLDSLSLPSSFFVLGEIAEKKLDVFRDLAKAGHDIGSHGRNHRRPMTLDLEEFRHDLDCSVEIMRMINGDGCFGYRAPCFSLDRERLDIISDSAFSYDASRIDFGDHPLYGSINMSGYQKISEAVYQRGNFMEFEATTLPLVGRRLPVSGGGYLRILPWTVMKRLIARHLSKSELYVFYIHPFEISNSENPPMPRGTAASTKLRFTYGRHSVTEKIKRLVDLLGAKGYSFTTFRELWEQRSGSNDR